MIQIPVLNSMRHNTLNNYVVPGLKSHLIADGDMGKVRLFENTREQVDQVIPHSHRYNFSALVLHGTVTNTIYRPYDMNKLCDGSSERYVKSILKTMPGQKGNEGLGAYGLIRNETNEPSSYVTESAVYTQGEVYSMKADQIHSIHFSKFAQVLMFEGPPQRDFSEILEPWVNGLVPTFRVEDWMFQPDAEGEAE